MHALHDITHAAHARNTHAVRIRFVCSTGGLDSALLHAPGPASLGKHLENSAPSQLFRPLIAMRFLFCL